MEIDQKIEQIENALKKLGFNEISIEYTIEQNEMQKELNIGTLTIKSAGSQDININEL